MPDQPASPRTDREAIQEAYLKEYRSGIQFFHARMVDLHLNTYILEKLIAFPLRLFLGPDLFFFRQVILNTFQASVLIITTLASDQGSDTYTLRRFHNKLFRQWLIPEAHPIFQEAFRAAGFSDDIGDLLDRAQRMRDHTIAHVLEHEVHALFSETTTKQEWLALSDLLTLREALRRFFQALTVNATYSMYPAGYFDDPSQSGGSSTDLKRVLNAIVSQNSSVLRRPEENPDIWQQQRHTLTSAQMRTFNDYRHMVGLPQA